MSESLIISTLGSLIAKPLGKFLEKIKAPVDMPLFFMDKGWCRKYNRFKDAQKYIQLGVKTSKCIKYFSIRGFPVSQITELREAIEDCYDPHVTTEFKILINDPERDEAEKRAREYNKIVGTPMSSYLKEIKDSFDNIIDLKQKIPRLEIRLHNNPALFRIVVFDEFCIIGFYTDQIIGRKSPVMIFKKKSIFYTVFNRYFDQTWEISKEKNEKY